MPWNQLIGTKEELCAKKWLAKKGYRLINQNWICCHGQVDIIATFFDQLHFIAVTAKNCAEAGLPQQGMTRKRMLAFRQAAQKYLERHPRWKEIVIDVLTVSIAEENPKFILMQNIRTA